MFLKNDDFLQYGMQIAFNVYVVLMIKKYKNKNISYPYFHHSLKFRLK